MLESGVHHCSLVIINLIFNNWSIEDAQQYGKYSPICSPFNIGLNRISSIPIISDNFVAGLFNSNGNEGKGGIKFIS